MGTRRYFIGGKPKTIEELDDVVAVHMDAGADRALPGAAGLEDMGTPVARAARSAPARRAIPGDVASAFARADWHFVLPSQALRADLAPRDASAAQPDVGRLFRRPDGSVMVATNTLTVQLRPDLTDDQWTAVNGGCDNPQTPSLFAASPGNGASDGAIAFSCAYSSIKSGADLTSFRSYINPRLGV